MEKVKITVEQEKAIELYKGAGHNLAVFVANHKGFHNYLKPLKTMSIDDMARILYQPNSYEVEPEINVGDLVISKVTGDIGKVTRIKKNGDVVTDVKLVNHRDDFFLTGRPHAFEKKTPQEIAEEKTRRWWAKHGRKLWEIKEFDELRDTRNDRRYTVSEDIESKNIGLLDTYVSYRYFTPDKIKENFLVVCFAEGRKDI